MNDAQWEEKLKQFLHKTGEDFKRFGKDVKQEAEHLFEEMQDPERQKKMKAGLKEVGEWAKKTADEVAAAMEVGAKKAGVAWGKAAEKVRDFSTAPAPGAPKAPAPKPAAPQAPKAAAPAAAPAAAGPVKKTVGRGKKATARKAPARAKKTIGPRPAAPVKPAGADGAGE